MTQEPTGIEDAIRIAGSDAKLGKLLNVSRQAVAEWRKQGYAPPERVADIALATGVDPARLSSPVIAEIVDLSKKMADDQS